MANQVDMHLETQYLIDAYKDFDDSLNRLSEIKSDIKTNKELLDTVWVGKAKKMFDSQYELLFNQISDIKDGLQDIYDALVETESTYEEIDNEIAQKIIITE